MNLILHNASRLASCVSLVTSCLAADDSDRVLISVREFSYRGVQCAGCDKNFSQEFDRSFGISAPIAGSIFAVSMVPHRDQGGVRLEIVVTSRPEEPDSHADQSKDSAESKERTVLAEETVLVPDNTSKPLAFGDISFRLFYAVPKLLSIPDTATVKDDQGAEVRGSVVLAARILEDGSVKRVTIMRSDDERLNEAAQTAMMGAKYAPPTMDGKPYSLIAYHIIEF